MGRGYNRCPELCIEHGNKLIIMINSYGYFSGEYVRATGLPFSKSERQSNWLSKTQCKIIKQPVLEDEEYNGIVGFARAMHGYYALYERNINEDDINLLIEKGKYNSR